MQHPRGAAEGGVERRSRVMAVDDLNLMRVRRVRRVEAKREGRDIT